MIKLPILLLLAAITLSGLPVLWAANPPAFPEDPAAILERTSFQTSQSWSGQGNLRADVAMVYGIDSSLPERVKSWRDRGYRVHLMTGVSWGQYQDYLYGRFDGKNHEDNAQTDRNGKKISHGGDVYYTLRGHRLRFLKSSENGRFPLIVSYLTTQVSRCQKRSL